MSLQEKGTFLKRTLDEQQKTFRWWSVPNSRQRRQKVRQPSPRLLKRRRRIV